MREALVKLLPQWIKDLPTHMDYDGQRRAEKNFQVIIILFAVVGFVWGYVCQQFSQTVYILFAGFSLASLLTLPPWPMYRRKPLKWQEARPKEAEETAASGTPAGTTAERAAGGGTLGEQKAGAGKGKKKK